MQGNSEQAGVTTAEYDFWSAPDELSLASSVPDVPAAHDLRVEPDKILDVARVIEQQASDLAQQVLTKLDALQIQSPADDIVSRNAIEGWNTVVAAGPGSYAEKVKQYVEDLRLLAQDLREASGHYRASEEDKREAFDERRGYPV